MTTLSAAEAAAAVLDAVERDFSIATAAVIASAAEAAASAKAGSAVEVASAAGIRPGARLAVVEDETVLGDFGGMTERVVNAARELLQTGGSRILTIDGVSIFVDAVLPPNHLVIVGAGHIAVPLAEIGVLLGYRVSVLDDREEFATEARFPSAAAVKRVDFTDPFADVRISARTHVVLVTRAHKYDYDCLLRLVEAPVAPKYVGMIGSRRRVRAAFHALLEHGITRERLAGVHAPVGIDIGAETPAEISVSIAAEIIAVNRGGIEGESLTARERVLDRLLKEA